MIDVSCPSAPSESPTITPPVDVAVPSISPSALMLNPGLNSRHKVSTTSVLDSPSQV